MLLILFTVNCGTSIFKMFKPPVTSFLALQECWIIIENANCKYIWYTRTDDVHIICMSTHGSHTHSILKLHDISLSFYGHVQSSGSTFLKQWKYFGSPSLFSEQRPFWCTFIQKHREKANHLPGKGNEGRGWMGLDGIVLETEEWRSPPPPLFYPNGVGWGADMARISALVGVGVGLTFWDILRFINAPVDIKPRSSDWRGGFCLCVPGVGSSQIHPHPLSHSPRA